jgi:hypothetical protein
MRVLEYVRSSRWYLLMVAPQWCSRCARDYRRKAPLPGCALLLLERAKTVGKCACHKLLHAPPRGGSGVAGAERSAPLCLFTLGLTLRAHCTYASGSTEADHIVSAAPAAPHYPPTFLELRCAIGTQDSS